LSTPTDVAEATPRPFSISIELVSSAALDALELGLEIGGTTCVLIRVRTGVYTPAGAVDREETLEPKGQELWFGEVRDLTVTALLDAKVAIEPGTWYPLEDFKALIGRAHPDGDGGIYSTVNTAQPGVGKAWIATIEVKEVSAALMVCRAVIDLVERLRGEAETWVRVE
jgi:hypothetical protein